MLRCVVWRCAGRAIPECTPRVTVESLSNQLARARHGAGDRKAVATQHFRHNKMIRSTCGSFFFEGLICGAHNSVNLFPPAPSVFHEPWECGAVPSHRVPRRRLPPNQWDEGSFRSSGRWGRIPCAYRLRLHATDPEVRSSVALSVVGFVRGVLGSCAQELSGGVARDS